MPEKNGLIDKTQLRKYTKKPRRAIVNGERASTMAIVRAERAAAGRLSRSEADRSSATRPLVRVSRPSSHERHDVAETLVLEVRL